MRPLLLSISALLLLSATALPGGVAAQAADPNTPVSSEAEGVVAAPAAQEVPAAGSPLPEGADLPRAMRPYWHVFAAFAVAWILLFGYALAMGRRFARLEEEVRRLGGAAE